MTGVPQRRTTRRVLLVLGAVSFLIAGVVSFYASSSPDGLEHVAATTGFGDTARPHATSDGPLAGYSVKGVHNDRVSGGLAGVIGVTATLVIAGGVTLLVRRRSGADASAPDTGRS
ncbi:PDGLE domain-containing protein [Aeromicrobium wangtongii]|uniref:PDGLE domain-containing protein n=1 Tax=Aeromicrobium wangtongii TaxID=2969247 RepID=UPI002016B358|nr:PDGLE domain-containing protein [Aeromicrobium wangtongii]MCL3818658.1 PDGLE domain-containing protein [Aeromicrobium wangtongii]